MSAGFHMKGNAYRGLQEHIAKAVPGGMPAVLEELTPHCREFFTQLFTAAGWYDVLPIDELTRVCAKLSSIPHEEFCQRYGDSTLERDKNGVYRALLRFATPDLLVRALPYTTKRYFDFVSLTVANIDPRSYTVTVTGIPREIAFTYIYVTTVFIVRAVEGAGAQRLQNRTTTPHPIGMKFGRQICQFERHLSWDL